MAMNGFCHREVYDRKWSNFTQSDSTKSFNDDQRRWAVLMFRRNKVYRVREFRQATTVLLLSDEYGQVSVAHKLHRWCHNHTVKTDVIHTAGRVYRIFRYMHTAGRMHTYQRLYTRPTTLPAFTRVRHKRYKTTKFELK